MRPDFSLKLPFYWNKKKKRKKRIDPKNSFDEW